MIDLKEFPEDTALKLIKTLKKQLPKMINADVTKDNNVIVIVKQDEVEETAKTIRRLKICQKRLICTILNQQDRKSQNEISKSINKDQTVLQQKKEPNNTVIKKTNNIQTQAHEHSQMPKIKQDKVSQNVSSQQGLHQNDNTIHIQYIYSIYKIQLKFKTKIMKAALKYKQNLTLTQVQTRIKQLNLLSDFHNFLNIMSLSLYNEFYDLIYHKFAHIYVRKHNLHISISQMSKALTLVSDRYQYIGQLQNGQMQGTLVFNEGMVIILKNLNKAVFQVKVYSHT
ncbi:Hypothetical_protein [Hexamita inflata]|uniref:Hypothetical_protein n=1 Tax=Hexamita inflata TaxID=28002 RepID=A0AA86RJI7_9EUKA|nr:Hypothetical protein HINF_LOCUS63236 [Hexamita inflata]